MKKLISLVLLCCLTACSVVHTPTADYSPDLAAQLAEAEVFSEPLEPLDAELIWILYGLDQSKARQGELTAGAGYCSAGATCEQVVVLTFSSEDSAAAAYDGLELYLDSQLQANRNYRPTEVPKLEKAILSRRGSTLLLLVAEDYDTAAKLINS